MRRKWFDDKMNSNIPVLIAEQNNRVAGFATYGKFRERAGYKYSVEHSVYIHPDFQKQGIASALLQSLIDEIKQKEIHTIIAGIDADNTVSIHLHEKFGFEQTSHFKQVAYKFGKWRDLIFMQLFLPDSFKPNEN
jgi:phosphinothricin acetyltransferase